MIAKHLCTMFLVCVLFDAFPQSQIKGFVYNKKDGKVLVGASVVVYENSLKLKILSYAITDSKGFYVLTSFTDSSLIKVSLFSYQSQEIRISNISQEFIFSLEESVEDIAEIIVQSPLVVISGDTILYEFHP